MKRMKIKMQGIDEPSRLVAETNLIKGDVNIKRGNYCVDGKSLLGVLALGEAKEPFIIEFPDDVSQNFIDFLRQFEVI